MYVLKSYRGLGIAQKMLDTAIQFARRSGYLRMVLDSSRELTAARSLYLKNGFIDFERYNDNQRADVFMQKVL
jgi:GNAT superfamily N-acetyltransferase